MFIYLGSDYYLSEITVACVLSGVSEVFLLAGLDRCELCRGCEWVWFRALSKWSSVSGVRHTWGVLLHLSPLLQWPLVQPALWPVRPPPQSLPEQLHLPDMVQWNSLLQMPSWWANTYRHNLTLMVHFPSLYSQFSECDCTIIIIIIVVVVFIQLADWILQEKGAIFTLCWH